MDTHQPALACRMAALLKRVLEKDRTGAPLPLPAVARGVRGSRFAIEFGRMLQVRVGAWRRADLNNGPRIGQAQLQCHATARSSNDGYIRRFVGVLLALRRWSIVASLDGRRTLHTLLIAPCAHPSHVPKLLALLFQTTPASMGAIGCT